MTRWQDTVAIVVITTAAILLFASAPARPTNPSAQLSQNAPAEPTSRSPQNGRELCERDIKKFCAAVVGGPQKMKSCMQGNAAQLEPACRSALESAGLISK
jgi:hypothetical protein